MSGSAISLFQMQKVRKVRIEYFLTLRYVKLSINRCQPRLSFLMERYSPLMSLITGHWRSTVVALVVLLKLPQTYLQIKDVFFSDGVFELFEIEQSVTDDVDAVQKRVEG